MLQDTGQMVPGEAEMDAGAPLPAAPPAPMPASASSAHPSPKGCRMVPGSLQGTGTIHAVFTLLQGWVWGHPLLLLPFLLPQAMGHYPQLLRQSTSPRCGVPASPSLLWA